jgi:hypothetical protein
LAVLLAGSHPAAAAFDTQAAAPASHPDTETVNNQTQLLRDAYACSCVESYMGGAETRSSRDTATSTLSTCSP